MVEVPTAEDRQVVEDSPRAVLTHRSANALAFGARVGVRVCSSTASHIPTSARLDLLRVERGTGASMRINPDGCLVHP
jgi:hypothetical protein